MSGIRPAERGGDLSHELSLGHTQIRAERQPGSAGTGVTAATVYPIKIKDLISSFFSADLENILHIFF